MLTVAASKLPLQSALPIFMSVFVGSHSERNLQEINQ